MATLFMRCLSTAAKVGLEKSALASLRKKTGYTFANCKKALVLADNDAEKAEEWLHSQAQTLGWSKATKLQDRPTSQGLVGMLVNMDKATMVELNCETDFVARNDQFQDLLKLALDASFEYINKIPLIERIKTVELGGEELRSLPADDGQPLNDHLAIMIGKVGENSILRRAACMKSSADVHIYGYSHPADTTNRLMKTGKYGALIGLRSESEGPVDGEIAKQLCQHIVGMAPKKIGVLGVDTPTADQENEPCLIYQEFLSDPAYLVSEILAKYKIKVVDYVRYECGEPNDVVQGRKLHYVKN